MGALRGEHYDIEHRIVVDGSIKWVREQAELEFDKQGGLLGGFGTTQDITGRKLAEESLKETKEALKKANEALETRVRERTAELKKTIDVLHGEIQERISAQKTIEEQSDILNSLFKDTLTPLVLLDRDFNFIRVNEAYARVCAKDVSEFMGHNHFEFYPHGENETIFRTVVETKFPYQAIAKPFVFPDHPEWGVTYWDWTLTPLLDEAGEVDFLVFSLKDVTDRQRAEEQLQKSEHKYRMLIEQAADGIVLLDRELNLVDVNSTACEMTGFTREELLKLNAVDLYQPGELEERSLRLDEVLAGETVITERKATKKDGSPIEVEISAKLIEGGNIQAIVRDITERKKEERRSHFV
jgi:PAS domain S-box-containing protein